MTLLTPPLGGFLMMELLSSRPRVNLKLDAFPPPTVISDSPTDHNQLSLSRRLAPSVTGQTVSEEIPNS